MKSWSVIFYLFFCVNFAALILNEAQVLPYAKPAMFSTDWFRTKFDISLTNPTLWTVIIGGSVIGVVAWLFKQYTYGGLILIVWVVGIFIPILGDFLLAFPTFIFSILPTDLAYLGWILVAYNAIMFFMFIIQIITQRSVET